jgi:V8-like Glu-specific endopeptidase
MPLDWKSPLSDLNVRFARLYPDVGKARFVVRQAGLDPDEINWVGVPKVFWMHVLEEANRRDRILELLGVVCEEFPNIDFRSLKQRLANPAGDAIAPALREDDWKAPPAAGSDLEKVIETQPTFLPISFLEKGLIAARAVVCIRRPQAAGTGFMIRGGLLVTNNHVLPDAAAAAAASIRFNYQTTVAGADEPVVEYELAPASFFGTSPSNGGDDWTVVRVKGDTAKWGFLELADVAVKVKDYVNIIQHPHGLPKQIALYHNVVAFADDSRVQYLTDTERGSSGSPVFDSNWNVVALHHMGGDLPEPGSGGATYLRNQGIHVRALLRGLAKHGLPTR